MNRPVGPGHRVAPLLAALFDAVPFGVAFYDSDLRIIDVNDSFAAMTGLPRSLHVGRPLEEVLPLQAEQIAPHLRAVFATGTPAEGVSLEGLRNPSASRPGHWVASYHAVQDAGVTVAAIAIVSDVSAQRTAEAILVAQKELLERCAQGQPLDVLLGDLMTVIKTHASAGAIPSVLLIEHGRMFHAAAPHLPAAYVEAIDGEPIGEARGSCGTAAFRGEGVFVADVAVDPLWTGYREVALAHGLRACWSVPIKSLGGAVLGTFALYYREPREASPEDRQLIDLVSRTAAVLIDWRRGDEARARLFEAEKAARLAAEESSRSKDDFVAMLSHELRTPLSAIVGWAQILRLPDIDAATSARALAAIERNAHAQARLVEDLLDMSRIIRGRLELALATVDLAVVARAAIEAVTPVAGAMRVALIVDLPATEMPVTADAGRLQQVLWNLLTNAVKFTPPGGEVRLALERQARVARVSVSDTGIGIAPELLPSIFDRYKQVDEGTGGLGLGLAIARHIAEMHGGSLTATSAGLGQGARFELVLPLGGPS